MENKPKKTPCCTALLAHVGAMQRSTTQIPSKCAPICHTGSN